MTFPEFCEEHELKAEEIELAWAMIQIMRAEDNYMKGAGTALRLQIDRMALELYSRKPNGLAT